MDFIIENKMGAVESKPIRNERYEDVTGFMKMLTSNE